MTLPAFVKVSLANTVALCLTSMTMQHQSSGQKDTTN